MVMTRAIIHRLPIDTKIAFETALNIEPKIYISMTLSTLDHISALEKAIEVAIRPILEMALKSREAKEAVGDRESGATRTTST